MSTANANYGATSDSSSAPPAYSAVVSPTEHRNRSSEDPSSGGHECPHGIAFSVVVALAMFLTFVLTVCFCVWMTPPPCNDPTDPEVRQRIRADWAREQREHESLIAKREVVKARWAWEDEERVRLRLFWGRVEAHQCVGYGTREYSAVLMNLPTSWEQRVEACQATLLEVHGVSYLPKSCEVREEDGVVIGQWEVDQNEPGCRTFWTSYKDLGCTSPGSGKRRIEQYLENLPRGADYREFCATTPARFLGMKFTGAQKCAQIHRGASGWWEIDDANCCTPSRPCVLPDASLVDHHPARGLSPPLSTPRPSRSGLA